jgi:hypothetical protein
MSKIKVQKMTQVSRLSFDTVRQSRAEISFSSRQTFSIRNKFSFNSIKYVNQ